MSDFLLGAHYVWRGLQIIFQSGMKRFLIIPITLNLAIFLGLYLGFAHLVAHGNHWLVQHVPAWLAWLQYIMWLLASLLFLILFIYTFVLIGNVIAAPFNSMIAEKILLQQVPQRLSHKTYWQLLKTTPQIMGRQCRILFYYLRWILPLLLLFIMPGLQIFAPFAWLMFGAWFMALSYFDYPADNLNADWGQVYAFAKNNRLLAFGFGLSNFLLAAIPLVNLIAVPAGVAAGTLLWLNRAPQLPPTSPGVV